MFFCPFIMVRLSFSCCNCFLVVGSGTRGLSRGANVHSSPSPPHMAKLCRIRCPFMGPWTRRQKSTASQINWIMPTVTLNTPAHKRWCLSREFCVFFTFQLLFHSQPLPDVDTVTVHQTWDPEVCNKQRETVWEVQSMEVRQNPRLSQNG